MNPIPTPGIPEYIQASADDMMQRVLDGKIRKHLLNDNSAVYTQYEDVVAEFTEQGIKNKYAVIYKEADTFLSSLDAAGSVRIDETILMHAVMDYFTDISRIQGFHRIRQISDIKEISYDTYWLMRRKPLQVLSSDGDEEFWAFINEKFAFSRVASFLTRRQRGAVLEDESTQVFLDFLDTLYYFLKYREYSPKILELILMGFQTGQLFPVKS
nr:hypothetical protein [uncultured Sellimonas sp.]